MKKGRSEDVQKFVDQHFSIIYRPNDFATGIYQNRQRKRQPGTEAEKLIHCTKLKQPALWQGGIEISLRKKK